MTINDYCRVICTVRHKRNALHLIHIPKASSTVHRVLDSSIIYSKNEMPKGKIEPTNPNELSQFTCNNSPVLASQYTLVSRYSVAIPTQTRLTVGPDRMIRFAACGAHPWHRKTQSADWEFTSTRHHPSSSAGQPTPNTKSAHIICIQH